MFESCLPFSSTQWQEYCHLATTQKFATLELIFRSYHPGIFLKPVSHLSKERPPSPHPILFMEGQWSLSHLNLKNGGFVCFHLDSMSWFQGLTIDFSVLRMWLRVIHIQNIPMLRDSHPLTWRKMPRLEDFGIRKDSKIPVAHYSNHYSPKLGALGWLRMKLPWCRHVITQMGWSISTK